MMPCSLFPAPWLDGAGFYFRIDCGFNFFFFKFHVFQALFMGKMDYFEESCFKWVSNVEPSFLGGFSNQQVPDTS